MPWARASEPTKMGTEIAALEARRNAEQTRAEGAYLGERRVAIARCAMVVMFAIIGISGGASSKWQTFAGAIYTGFSVATVVGVWRSRGGDPKLALWRPLLVTTVDFTLITTLALLDQQSGAAFAPGRHAIATAIIISFAVARHGLVHVRYAVVLALVSLAIAATRGAVL